MHTITEYISIGDYDGLRKEYEKEDDCDYIFLFHQRYITPISDIMDGKYGEFFDKSIDEEGRISSAMRSHIRTTKEGVVIRESIICYFSKLDDALEYLDIFLKKGYKLFENLEITKNYYMI